MSKHLAHRDAEPRLDDARPAPGKAPVTARLAPRPIVFRVESAEAARELGAAFGPRDANGVAAGADRAIDRAAASSGTALPGDVRARFESSLGADLAGVRVHTGADSASAAHAVGARAYTTGQDIHFAAGQYAPTDPFGIHLLAHEVAHTVQQSAAAPSTQYKLEVSTPGDAAEVEADRAADAMVAGTSFAVGASAAPAALARKPAPDGNVTVGPVTQANPTVKWIDLSVGSIPGGTKEAPKLKAGEQLTISATVGGVPDPKKSCQPMSHDGDSDGKVMYGDDFRWSDDSTAEWEIRALHSGTSTLTFGVIFPDGTRLTTTRHLTIVPDVDEAMRDQNTTSLHDHGVLMATTFMMKVIEAVKSFESAAAPQIDAMAGDPSDLWGLIPTWVSGIGGAIAAAYPPAGIAAALTAAVQASVQTWVVKDVKDEHADAKATARTALATLVTKMLEAQQTAANDVQNELPLRIRLLWYDDKTRALLTQYSPAVQTTLSDKLGVPDVTKKSPYGEVLASLSKDFARWKTKQDYLTSHASSALLPGEGHLWGTSKDDMNKIEDDATDPRHQEMNAQIDKAGVAAEAAALDKAKQLKEPGYGE